MVQLQKVIELVLATFYLFNQVGKSRNKNNLGKTMLLGSLLCILNSILFLKYAEFKETVELKNVFMKKFNFKTTLDIKQIGEYCEKIGEMLLISSAFYTNHSIIAKLYGLIRIPTFVYLDSVRYMFDANFTGFVENLVFGIEFVFAAFFILLNPIWSNKAVKNGKSLLLLYVTYGFTCYLLTLFKLPFEVNKNNMRAIGTVNSIINTVLYGLMANSMCHSTTKSVCVIKNPSKIAENQEAKMKALIEFNENY